MSKLHLDITEREITGEVLLKGEAAPITFTVNYHLDGAGETITLEAISCSKPWMELMARDFLVNKALPLPAEAAGWIRRLSIL